MNPRLTLTALITAFMAAPLVAETQIRGPDAVVVSATRIAQNIEDTSVPVSVVDRDELDRRQARDLSDVFSDRPGATTRNGPRRDGLMPSIRGLSDGRVVVRINGARQNFNIDHRGQTYLDPSLISRAEVSRGPGSTLFGSGAIGGVVNIATLTASEFLEEGESLGGSLELGSGSNNNERRATGTLATAGDSADLLASFTRSRSRDFRDGEGDDIRFSESDVQSALIHSGWDVNPATRISLSYLGFEDDSPSTTTADRQADADDRIDRRTRQQTTSLNLSYEPGTAFTDLDATLYFTDLDQRERQRDSGDTRVNGLSTSGIDVFNTSRTEIGSTFHQLTYGLEAYRDRQQGEENGQDRETFADATQDTLGLFLQDQIMLTDRLDLTLGARYDRIRQRPDDDDRERVTYHAVSPQSILTYQLEHGLAAYVSYAEAFRAPSLRELYVGGQHFPGNQFEPNPDLQPEEAANKEVGLTWSRRGWLASGDQARAQLSLFQNDVDDFIQQVVDRDNDTTRFENVAEVRLRGAEFELAYRHADHDLTAQVTHLRADDKASGDPLTGVSADELSVRYARLIPDQAAEVGVRGQLVASQDRLPEAERDEDPTPTHGYGLVDVFAAWSPTTAVRVSLRVDNLFNRTYRRGNALVNSAGRNLRVSARYRF